MSDGLDYDLGVDTSLGVDDSMLSEDTEASPMDLVLSNLGGSVGDFAKQAATLRELERQRRQEAADLLAKSKGEDYGPDMASLFGQALAAFLPGIVGKSLGGSKLAASGFEIGSKQSAAMQDRFLKDAKEQQALDVAQAEELSGLADRVGQQAQQMDVAGLQQAAIDARQEKSLARQRERDATSTDRFNQSMNLRRQQLAASRRGSESNDRIETGKRTELEQRKIPGLIVVPGSVPDSSDSKLAKNIWQAKLAMDVPFEQAKAAFRAGDREGMARTLARLIITMKSVDGMGANFTQMERNLQIAGLPGIPDYTSLDAITDYFRKTVNQYDPIRVLNATQAGLGDEVKAKLAAYKYYVPGDRYDSTFSAFGIPINEKGVADRSDYYDNYINTLYPNARGIGMTPPTQASTTAQSTAQVADPKTEAFLKKLEEIKRANKASNLTVK